MIEESTEFIDDSVFESLPECLKTITNFFEERERDIVLLSSLGVISNCLPNVMGVYDGFEVYPNIYIAIIAPPASGKGVMNLSLWLIEEINDAIVEESEKANEATKFKTKEVKKIVKRKIIPGNISTSELYSMIENAPHGGIVFESEADSLSKMFDQKWADFTDVLRGAFQHEKVSKARKEDGLLVIKEPKLSVVLSGTPDQVKPLVRSIQNGLFSRFIYYSYEAKYKFKDVFNVDVNRNSSFKELGAILKRDLWDVLYRRERALTFKMTKDQEQMFRSEMEILVESETQACRTYFSSYRSKL